MQSLQSITDTWGKWLAKKHGTKCMWTASTNYNRKDGRLDDYKDKKVVATPQSVIYHSNYQPTTSPSTVYEVWFDNSSELGQMQNLIKSNSSTESFTWSMTETLSIGIEVSASVGVEGVATASSTLSTSLSLSSTQEKTVSETQTWEVNTSINIPANSSIKCDLVIDSAKFDTDFTSPVLLDGCVAIWFDEKVNGHYLWFYSIGHVFKDIADNNITDISGYDIKGSDVIANAKGTFVGKEGLHINVVVTQYPLRTTTAPSEFKSINSYQMKL